MAAMAIIHQTAMTPTKVELLTPWLPGRPWYLGDGAGPRLAKAGGFRLDDPEGKVGLEFMAVSDVAGGEPVTYHVPLSYRDAPLPGADDALIGTAEHGVLGTRWVYDGTRDPVLVREVFALLLGNTSPQAQNISDTVDPSVSIAISGQVGEAPAEIVTTADGPRGTDITVRTQRAPGPVMLRVKRVLRPDRPGLMAGTLGHVTAEWTAPGGRPSRGRFIVLRVA